MCCPAVIIFVSVPIHECARRPRIADRFHAKAKFDGEGEKERENGNRNRVHPDEVLIRFLCRVKYVGHFMPDFICPQRWDEIALTGLTLLPHFTKEGL